LRGSICEISGFLVPGLDSEVED